MAADSTKLQEAKDALHNLAIGRSARVIVDQNGERVEFTAANMDRLRAYIASLEAECNSTGYPRPSGPYGFLF